MRTIVLVDDDPDIQESIKMVLENAGFGFKGAQDRKSGMQLIESEKPDLIILDVMMEQPDDGFVLAQDLRTKGVTTPIIMLTSIGSVTGMTFGMNSDVVSVDDFEEKPISPVKLLEKVKGLLENGGE